MKALLERLWAWTMFLLMVAMGTIIFLGAMMIHNARADCLVQCQHTVPTWAAAPMHAHQLRDLGLGEGVRAQQVSCL